MIFNTIIPVFSFQKAVITKTKQQYRDVEQMIGSHQYCVYLKATRNDAIHLSVEYKWYTMEGILQKVTLLPFLVSLKRYT